MLSDGAKRCAGACAQLPTWNVGLSRGLGGALPLPGLFPTVLLTPAAPSPFPPSSRAPPFLGSLPDAILQLRPCPPQKQSNPQPNKAKE